VKLPKTSENVRKALKNMRQSTGASISEDLVDVVEAIHASNAEFGEIVADAIVELSERPPPEVTIDAAQIGAEVAKALLQSSSAPASVSFEATVDRDADGRMTKVRLNPVMATKKKATKKRARK
jgi:hypothetical protein